MKIDSPKISIIIPIYNAESTLVRCINSILSQSLKDIEIILVDDGSNDSSGKLCDDYAEQDKRIKVIHKANGGAGAARNSGLAISNGEYITFIDSDDWLCKENGLKDFYSFAKNQDLDIAYCDHFGKPNGLLEERVYQDFGSNNIECTKAMLSAKNWNNGMQGYCWNKIYRRYYIESTKQNFLEGYDLWEDLGLNIRLFALTTKIGYAKDICYYTYNCPPGKTSIAHNPDKNNSLYLKRCFERKENIEYAILILKEKGLFEQYEKEILECKYRVRSFFLSSPQGVSIFPKILSETNSLFLSRFSNRSFLYRISFNLLLNGYTKQYLILEKIKSYLIGHKGITINK